MRVSLPYDLPAINFNPGQLLAQPTSPPPGRPGLSKEVSKAVKHSNLEQGDSSKQLNNVETSADCVLKNIPDPTVIHSSSIQLQSD